MNLNSGTQEKTEVEGGGGIQYPISNVQVKILGMVRLAVQP